MRRLWHAIIMYLHTRNMFGNNDFFLYHIDSGVSGGIHGAMIPVHNIQQQWEAQAYALILTTTCTSLPTVRNNILTLSFGRHPTGIREQRTMLTHWDQSKMAFSRWHTQGNFHKRKCLYCDTNFTQIWLSTQCIPRITLRFGLLNYMILHKAPQKLWQNVNQSL